MKKNWKNLVALWLAWILAAATWSCAGGLPNAATAPAPLAEIPANLNFPDDISVDTHEVAIGGSVPSASKFAATTGLDYIKNEVLPIGGEFFAAITFGFTTNEAIDLAVAAVLQDLHALQIPLNPITPTFEVTGPTGGIFLGNGVKIDFADFDYFGTGNTVGCTGCTCPTGCSTSCPSQAPFEDLKPVCFRIWVDKTGTGEFSRLMAGFFEQLPIEDNPATPENEKNPGVGTYRGNFVEFSGDGVTPIQITNFGADYNHRNPDLPFDISTEYFLGFILPPPFGPPNATLSDVKIEHHALTDDPNAPPLLKTIRESVNQEIFGDPTLDSNFKYIARYRTDKDFWSGTFLNSLFYPATAFAVPPPIGNFTAECAQLSTAIGVDQGTCIDLGIDVTNVPFLDLIPSTDSRVNLPADFPNDPTF